MLGLFAYAALGAATGYGAFRLLAARASSQAPSAGELRAQAGPTQARAEGWLGYPPKVTEVVTNEARTIDTGRSDDLRQSPAGGRVRRRAATASTQVDTWINLGPAGYLTAPD